VKKHGNDCFRPSNASKDSNNNTRTIITTTTTTTTIATTTTTITTTTKIIIIITGRDCRDWQTYHHYDRRHPGDNIPFPMPFHGYVVSFHNTMVTE